MRTPFTRDARGQSMVEFALVLLPFIMLMVGLFDVGRGIYAYTSINNAAREAARLGIVDQTVEDIRSEALAQAVSVDLDDADVDVSFFLTSSGPGSACPNVGDDTVVYCSVQVVIEYDYAPVTPLISTVFGPVTMIADSQFQIESNCVATPGPTCPAGDD